MKSAKSERTLLAAADQPKPGNSRWSDLKQKGLKLYESVKGTTSDLVQAATIKAQTTQVYVNKRLKGVREHAKHVIRQGKLRASKLAQPLVSGACRVVETAQATKQFGLDMAASAKASAHSQYEHLRTRGLKIYSIEAVQGMSQLVRRSAQETRSKVSAVYSSAVSASFNLLDSSCKQAQVTATKAKAKTAELTSKTLEVVKDSNFQATAAGAAGGAAAFGASGGVAGLTAGSVVGAAVGVVPALFTFGLSIPICAALGGGAGLVVGTAVGGATGALGGGAAGYGLHAKSGDLREGAQRTAAQLSSSADFVMGKVLASANFVGEKASDVRQRLVGRFTAGKVSKSQ